MELDIPSREREALKAIDTEVLGRKIEQCLTGAHASSLLCLGIDSCGQYVSSKFRAFQRATEIYQAAKSAKKIVETKRDALEAADDLQSAVRSMKQRLELEESESQLFRINSYIMRPISISEHLSVHVGYQWRPSNSSEWIVGSIRFIHHVVTRRDYMAPVPRRKPSAAKLRLEREDSLYRDWEYLAQQSLYSLREFFRSGGTPDVIPETFVAKTDALGRLNNFSTRFWDPNLLKPK